MTVLRRNGALFFFCTASSWLQKGRRLPQTISDVHVWFYSRQSFCRCFIEKVEANFCHVDFIELSLRARIWDMLLNELKIILVF